MDDAQNDIEAATVYTLAAPVAGLRSHKWTGRQQGGCPSEIGSYEWVRYCDVCGVEDTHEDPPSPCTGNGDTVQEIIALCNSTGRILCDEIDRRLQEYATLVDP